MCGLDVYAMINIQSNGKGQNQEGVDKRKSMSGSSRTEKFRNSYKMVRARKLKTKKKSPPYMKN